MAYMRYMGRRTDAGFSLIELMVALALGVVILLAVSEVFISNSRTRTEIENTSRQIENGRYAMQLLENELINAGFFGESQGAEFPETTPPACPVTASDVRDAMGVPVYGQNNVASGSEPTCLSGYKGGGDYLAIRRSSTCSVDDAGGDCDGFNDNHYHIQVSACQSDNLGEITLGVTSTSMTAMTRTCVASENAPVYRLLSRLYYVNDDDVLVRAELQSPTASTPYAIMPLVDGIERLHFEYGLDNTGDGEVDTFEASPEDDEWEDVVAVRIWLLARNQVITQGYTDERSYVLGSESAYTPNDGYKRQLYTSTVRMNNVAGRRENP